MTILMFIITIGIIVPARIIFKKYKKTCNTTNNIPDRTYKLSDGFPDDDPYVTSPGYSYLANNIFYGWDD